MTKQHESEFILISPLHCLEIENALEKMKKGFWHDNLCHI